MALSSFSHYLPYLGTLAALVVALGTFAWRVARAMLLHRAGVTALRHGSKDPRGRAGLRIVDALTSDNEPWYLALLPGHRRDDGQP